MDEKQNLLSIGEVAERFGVHVDTLRKWEQRGLLFPHYTKGGHRRYELSDVEKMIRKKSDKRNVLMSDELFQHIQKWAKVESLRMETRLTISDVIRQAVESYIGLSSPLDKFPEIPLDVRLNIP